MADNNRTYKMPDGGSVTVRRMLEISPAVFSCKCDYPIPKKDADGIRREIAIEFTFSSQAPEVSEHYNDFDFDDSKKVYDVFLKTLKSAKL
jgi:hypothetical protein